MDRDLYFAPSKQNLMPKGPTPYSSNAPYINFLILSAMRVADSQLLPHRFPRSLKEIW